MRFVTRTLLPAATTELTDTIYFVRPIGLLSKRLGPDRYDSDISVGGG